MQTQKPILFFDGLCHLCNGFVDEVIQRDHQERFQFAPIQGETAKKTLTTREREHLETVILYDENQKYYRSEAVLRVLIALGGVYSLFRFAYLIPRSLRNAIYSWVARHRYSWFGQREFCRLPTPAEKNRLLP